MSDIDPDITSIVEEEELSPLEPSTIQLDTLEAEKAAISPSPEDERPFIEHRDVKWHTVAELPGSVSLSLSRLKDKGVSDGSKSSIIHDVIFYAIISEERGEFSEWLNNAEPIIDITELMEILQKLIERVLNRPTQ